MVDLNIISIKKLGCLLGIIKAGSVICAMSCGVFRDWGIVVIHDYTFSLCYVDFANTRMGNTVWSISVLFWYVGHI